MTEELKPCPWCAGTDIQVVPHRMSPTMEKEGELISVEVRHHCPQTNGQPSRAVVRIGRDYESAIKAWNTRAESEVYGNGWAVKTKWNSVPHIFDNQRDAERFAYDEKAEVVRVKIVRDE